MNVPWRHSAGRETTLPHLVTMAKELHFSQCTFTMACTMVEKQVLAGLESLSAKL